MAEPSLKEVKELYENGKHRRYSLLFSVNGGVFAIAKFFIGEPGKMRKPEEALMVLGSLTLRELSIGMVAFTIAMTFDIYMFGGKMKKLPQGEGEFHWPGKVVLFMIGGLICAGWLRAGLG